jgi:tRNA pseudouridine38-40 synthase
MTTQFGVLLEVAYDGTDFSGWATQKTGRTVQDTLYGALRAIDPYASMPRGTSRTDAGVHAEGQLAAFDASRDIDLRGWVLATNRGLPSDVGVRSARFAPHGFNPRFASRSKVYRYRVLLDRVRNPLERTRAWHVAWPVDVERLTREARAIEGRHDFAAFRSAHDARKDTVRTISRVSVETTAAWAPLQAGGGGIASPTPARAASSGELIAIAIEGDGFLYNMVRILVGTLMDVARGKLAEGTIARALASGERRTAGITAPAHGLTLESVDIEWPEAGGMGPSWPQ